MKKIYIFGLSILSMTTLNAQDIFSSDLSSWTDGKPDGFMGSKSHEVDLTVAEISIEADHGTSLAQLETTGTVHRRLSTQPLSVTDGESYDVIIYAKGEGDMRVGMFDDHTPTTSAGFIFYSNYSTLNSTSTQLYNFTVTATNTTTIAEFIISVRNTEAPNHIQIDSVSIEVASVTPPSNVSIYDIQFTEVAGEGSTYPSLHVGEYVRTSGIVTAKYNNGYFIQDGDGAWNGLQVYSPSNDVTVGEEITIVGTVHEQNGMTQLKDVVSVTVESTGNTLPVIAEISTLNVNEEMYESVLIRVTDATCTDADLGFDEWEVNDGSGASVVGKLFFIFSPVENEDYTITGVGFYGFGNYMIAPRSIEDVDGPQAEPQACDIGIFCDDFEGASLTANNEWERAHVVESPSSLNWFHSIYNDNVNDTVIRTARVSNYKDGANEIMEAWLISPSINLSEAQDPILRFDNTKRFEGDDLELLISTDYDGLGSPTSFTWTNISDRVNWNTNVGSWDMTSSGNINLSDFTGESISIAFKYVGGNSDGSTYQLDNILLQEFEAPSSTPIYDIQFTEVAGQNNTYPSPMVGETVTIYGVVTAVYGSGYFVQDAEGAWNGIQVFNNANTPALNDQVLVTGEVAEWNGVTQIASVSGFVNEGGATTLFDPVVISTSDISEEMYESVLCQVASATCTNADLGFGEWEINDGSGAGAVDNLMFDYSPTLNELYRVTGIGYYSFGTYKIEPRFEQDVEKVLNVTVSNMNQLNVYPNPAAEKVTLSGWENGIIRIVDVLGSVVLDHEVQNEKTVVNVSTLKTGIYFVQQNNNSVKLIIK